MLELGAFGAALHADLAVAIDEAGIDRVFACGPLMQNLWDHLPVSRRGAYAATSAQLSDALLRDVKPNDAVMIKGSLGSKMGPLADALRNRYAVRQKD
jgi:UDP-N-acetylmuramoyl-tripeptide--D-alanyl-D-alanine ligase